MYGFDKKERLSGIFPRLFAMNLGFYFHFVYSKDLSKQWKTENVDLNFQLPKEWMSNHLLVWDYSMRWLDI